MRLRSPVLLACSAILAVYPVFVSEALRYNFEDRLEDWTVEIQLADWTEVAGDWEVKDGQYLQKSIKENPEGLGTRSFFGQPEWSDYTIRVRAKVIEYGQNGWFAVTFRGENHERDHYLFQFGVQGGTMPTIVAKVQGGVYNPIGNLSCL